MRKCLLLGGTSDTRKVLDTIKDQYDEIFITVATAYGYEIFKDLESDHVKVLLIDFDELSMREFLKINGINEIFDSTHPYATKISTMAKKICEDMRLKYFYKKREKLSFSQGHEDLIFFASYEEAVNYIVKEGILPILITTGSKSAHKFSSIAKNSYIRILPFEESLQRVRKAGFPAKNIIAMQGPFSKELNLALIRHFKVKSMISKNSGKEGGIIEKIESCKIAKIPLIIVG